MTIVILAVEGTPIVEVLSRSYDGQLFEASPREIGDEASLPLELRSVGIKGYQRRLRLDWGVSSGRIRCGHSVHRSAADQKPIENTSPLTVLHRARSTECSFASILCCFRDHKPLCLAHLTSNKGIATSSNGISTRSNDATSGSWPHY